MTNGRSIIAMEAGPFVVVERPLRWLSVHLRWFGVRLRWSSVRFDELDLGGIGTDLVFSFKEVLRQRDLADAEKQVLITLCHS